MSKGKRYNTQQKLNLKRVIAVIIAIAVVALFAIGIKQILKADKTTASRKSVALTYHTLYTNGNWGIINSYGQIVIEPTNKEMLVIPDETKPIFISTYDVNYAEGTYKTKAINQKNEQIFTQYSNVSALQNYDSNNKLWFEANILKVEKEGKFGLINTEGTEILPCEYNNITTIKGVEKSIIIEKEGKIGLVNNTGKIIVPTEYAEITGVTNDYENGYIVKNAEGKFGIVKTDGTVALECKYDAIKNIADINKYIAQIDGTWKVVAEDGTIYLDGKVENAIAMNNGNVVINENGKMSVINTAEEIKIPAEYEQLSYMFDDKYIAKKDGKFGIIDTNGQNLIEFKYANIEYNKVTDYLKAQNDDGTFDYITRDLQVKLTESNETVCSGFIKIVNGADTKYYNYKLDEKTNKDVYVSNSLFLVKRDGKYGFVDKDGKTVVEAIYDDAVEQNPYGYVAVKKDGKWGAIDQDGKVVVEPTYTLENNHTISFIGKWHISADENANYYTDAE